MVGIIAKPIDIENMLEVIYRSIFVNEPIHASLKNSDLPTSNDSEVDFPEIDGLDVKGGLKRMGSQPSLYTRLLKGFCLDYQNLNEKLNPNQPEEMERVLHSFKGIAGTMGANNLYKLAIESEEAMKKESPGLENLLKNLLEETKIIIDRIQTMPFMK